MKEKWIYLDDMRTPEEDPDIEWIVVRNFHEFVERVSFMGLESIDGISFDHDLGPEAMQEYYNNVSVHYRLNYDNIEELTGYHACKWLVEHYYEKNPDRLGMERAEKKGAPFKFPRLTVHSANPIGAGNIIGYLNNFLKNETQPQYCERYYWKLK